MKEWKLGGIERLGSVFECKPLTYIVATIPARNIWKAQLKRSRLDLAQIDGTGSRAA
jgi:hypothetical protein